MCGEGVSDEVVPETCPSKVTTRTSDLLKGREKKVDPSFRPRWTHTVPGQRGQDRRREPPLIPLNPK